MQVSDVVNQYYNNLASGSEVSTGTKGVEQLVQTVSKLTSGQIFEGTVNSVKGNQVVLGLSSGQNVTARLDKGVSLSVGQSVFFQIKSNDGILVQIKPISMGTLNNPTLLNALDSANITVTEKSLNMVNAMMQEQMPIDSKALNEMSKMTSAFSNVDVATLVTLKKLDMPVNSQMIQQFENYKASEGAILKSVVDLSNDIPNAFQSANVSAKDIITFMSSMNDLLTQNVSARSLSNVDVNRLQVSIEAIMDANQEMNDGQIPFSTNGTTIVISGSDDILDASAMIGTNEKASVTENLPDMNPNIISQAESVTLPMPEMLQNTSEGVQRPQEILQEAVAAETTLIAQAEELVLPMKESNLTQNIQQMPLQQADEIQKVLLTLTPEVIEDAPAGSLLSKLKPEQFAQLSVMVKDIPSMTDFFPSLFDTDGNLKHDISAKDLFSAITYTLNHSTFNMKPDLMNMFSNDSFKALLAHTLADQWTVDPQQLKDSSAVKNLYQKIELDMAVLQNAANHATKDVTNPITQTASMIQDNVEFVNHVNQTFSYVQLPLKMAEQNSSGDLYVYTNKGKSDNDSGEVSAFLHFDMDHLGSTDISIKMRNKYVDTKFFMEDDASYELILNNIHILETQLSQLGYQCKIEVQNDAKKVNLITDVLEKDVKTSGNIQRYSFDVRA